MKTKRALKLLSTILLMTIIIGLSLFALQENIQLYQTPSEWLAHPSNNIIRLGGQVKKLKINGLSIKFNISDGKKILPVTYQGPLPALFKENKGAIVTGKFHNGVFYATSILAKHDENYQPREIL